MKRIKESTIILLALILTSIYAQRDFSDSDITKIVMLGSGNPNPSPAQSGCSVAIVVNDLINYFPSELLNENETIFGCPDCNDQGGLYTEYNVNGIHKYWIIDQSLVNVPNYLHDFMGKVNEMIDQINN